MRKMAVTFLVGFLFFVGVLVLSGKESARAQEKSSAKPRMIEVEESAWVKLNQDLLKMQDELIKSRTEVKVAQAELEREKQAHAEQAKGKSEVAVHRVMKNESLWKIAVKYYNDPFKWRWIFKANMRQVENPNLIYPEMILDMPRY